MQREFTYSGRISLFSDRISHKVAVTGVVALINPLIVYRYVNMYLKFTVIRDNYDKYNHNSRSSTYRGMIICQMSLAIWQRSFKQVEHKWYFAVDKTKPCAIFFWLKS